MKKLVFSIITVLLMTIFMMGTVFAKAVTLVKLEATIEITANKTSVVEGDEVEFTFTIKDLKNAKDDSIAAIEGKVEYNTDFFEFVSTTFSTGGQSGEKFNVTKVGKKGEVYAKLVLKVKENASGTGDVKFTELMASDGDMDKAEGDAEASTNPISFSYQIVNPITPPTNVTGVKINAAVTKIKVGGTVLLVPSFTPANPVNKNVTWSSSDNEVAVVYDNGLVKGRKEGTAIITVTTEDGYKTASIEITVVKNNEITGGIGNGDTDLQIIEVFSGSELWSNIEEKFTKENIKKLQEVGIIKQKGISKITLKMIQEKGLLHEFGIHEELEIFWNKINKYKDEV